MLDTASPNIPVRRDNLYGPDPNPHGVKIPGCAADEMLGRSLRTFVVAEERVRKSWENADHRSDAAGTARLVRAELRATHGARLSTLSRI